ncbi:hypothetical protein SCOR_35185 [Sulfidibacter corallicola]
MTCTGERIAPLFGSIPDRNGRRFDWWNKLFHLQARRPSHDAGTLDLTAFDWGREGENRLRSLAQWIVVAWVASKRRAGSPTYRPDAPLTMRGPWTLRLSMGVVREKIGSALWRNGLSLLGLLRLVEQAVPSPGPAALSRCGNSGITLYDGSTRFGSGIRSPKIGCSSKPTGTRSPQAPKLRKARRLSSLLNQPKLLRRDVPIRSRGFQSRL